MLSGHYTRRKFLQSAAAAGGSVLIAAHPFQRAVAQSPGKLHVSCNQYNWMVFYARDHRDFNEQSLDSVLAEVAKSGMDGFEPAIAAPEQIDQYAPLLKKHGLEMRSLYVNSSLHNSEQAEKSCREILAIAEKAKSIGTRIILTNPRPLRPEEGAAKDDAQLRIQAAALDKLGAKLKAIGLTLAYHNHAIELGHAAREFHHMMLGTDPAHVMLCLDAHWMYRGADNSAVALFDIVKLYGPRISEIHLRQSVKNVWTESFGDGDIDYPLLAQYLLGIGVKPHLVLEQAPEDGTPKTMNAVESHRRGREYVDRVFAAFAAAAGGRNHNSAAS